MGAYPAADEHQYDGHDRGSHGSQHGSSHGDEDKSVPPEWAQMMGNPMAAYMGGFPPYYPPPYYAQYARHPPHAPSYPPYGVPPGFGKFASGSSQGYGYEDEQQNHFGTYEGNKGLGDVSGVPKGYAQHAHDPSHSHAFSQSAGASQFPFSAPPYAPGMASLALPSSPLTGTAMFGGPGAPYAPPFSSGSQQSSHGASHK